VVNVGKYAIYGAFGIVTPLAILRKSVSFFGMVKIRDVNSKVAGDLQPLRIKRSFGISWPLVS